MQESLKGWFDLRDWGTVAVLGPDSVDYLQRMSTRDFRHWPADQAGYGCFLTGKAGVIALGTFLPVSGGYHYVVAPGLAAATAEHLEKFHFAENLTVSDVSGDWALFGVWGAAPAGPAMQLCRDGDTESWQDALRPELKWIRMPRAAADAWARAQAVPLLTPAVFEYHRLMCGMPRVGVEVSEKNLVIEANLELAISRNKGCYPGQEVVERIFTYGRVNRKLLPVSLETSGAWPSLPISVASGGAKAGTVVSAEREPGSSTRGVGLAYVHRNFWESSHTMVSEDGAVRVKRLGITI